MIAFVSTYHLLTGETVMHKVPKSGGAGDVNSQGFTKDHRSSIIADPSRRLSEGKLRWESGGPH